MIDDRSIPRLAAWVLRHDRLQFSAFGRVVADQAWERVTNRENALHRDGNHAWVGPGTPISAAGIAELARAQRSEGSTPCLDLYGEPDDRDALMIECGFRLDELSPSALLAWKSSVHDGVAGDGIAGDGFAGDGAGHRPSVVGKRAGHRPSVVEVPRERWPVVVGQVNPGKLEPMWRRVVEAESRMVCARFFAVFVGDLAVSRCALYDWQDAVQIESVATHPDFRRLGYAREMLETVLAASRSPVYLLVTASNEAAINLYKSMGGVVLHSSLTRRYRAAAPSSALRIA